MNNTYIWIDGNGITIHVGYIYKGRKNTVFTITEPSLLAMFGDDARHAIEIARHYGAPVEVSLSLAVPAPF